MPASGESEGWLPNASLFKGVESAVGLSRPPLAPAIIGAGFLGLRGPAGHQALVPPVCAGLGELRAPRLPRSTAARRE